MGDRCSAIWVLGAFAAIGVAAVADEPRDDRGGLRAGAWVGAGIEGGRTVRPLDPASTGTGALSRSLRVMPMDMRRSSGFGSVYAWDDQRLVRSSGAVHAVFPRSVVAEAGEIPAGTVFYIGQAPVTGGARGPKSPGAAQARPHTRVPTETRLTIGPGAWLEPISPIWDDRRARRVVELLERAYEAGQP